MTRSNPTHDTNDPKTTAASTPPQLIEGGTSNEAGSDSQPALRNATQVPISRFGFVPASQLRSEDLGLEGDDQEEGER